MNIDISRLGPAAQAQIAKALAENKRRKENDARRRAVTDIFDSDLEREYFARYIWPLILTGQIRAYDLHLSFELMPADEYCGIKLPAATYTPDFVIWYTSGEVEVVETKSKFVRKAQGSYIYRRRLFIEKYCRPGGWKFTEYIKN